MNRARSLPHRIAMAFGAGLPLLFAACGVRPAQGPGALQEFTALTNWPVNDTGVAVIAMDYTDALDSGFVVPSARQVAEGRFTFRFTLRDTTGTGARFHYKLYYLNDSYKFTHTAPDGKQHHLAHENFYGSWEDAGEGFRLSPPASREGITVTDAFRIRGDPRDQPEHRDDRGRPARWSRNPRVGEYVLMLVVVPETDFARTPPAAEVQDIRRTLEGRHMDPFWYWISGPGARLNGAEVRIASQRLKVEARPPLGAGIHVRPEHAGDRSAFSAVCGNDPKLSAQAPFEQFIHYVDASTRFANIPLIADVLGNEYTPADHDRYRCFFPADQMVGLRPMVAPTPCSTVRSDPERHVIELRNPASTDGDWRKENVGIRSRHGLAYGRYRVKCKLTRLLNDSDMWVGLTNAIWLIYDGAPGGLRRPCGKDGYMANYYGGDNDQRVPRVAYSEIDFEILKTPSYCPDRAFPPTYPQQLALPDDRNAWTYSTSDTRTDGRGMITVACTNWDMACHDPEDFDVGCHAIEKDGNTYVNHRWDHNYRAITQKTEAPDRELFGGDHYWFEIDWRPQEIFWRIGPDLEHLRTVAYMNNTVTEVSNVQMHLIVTQEWHNTRWWPGTPFDQGYIPFPAKDLVGEVQEVIIE